MRSGFDRAACARVTRHFDTRVLADEPEPIIALTDELEIAWFNRRWRALATDGSTIDVLAGWPIGSSILTAISDDLRPFYAAGFRRVLATNRVWEHDYECPTPDRLRTFRMRAHSLDGDGLLIVHSLRVESRAPSPDSTAPAHSYRNDDGLIRQCGHCRRTRTPVAPHRWDWVPALLAPEVERVSHGLCRPCLSYYYPEASGY